MDPSCSDTVVYMRTSILMELLLSLYGGTSREHWRVQYCTLSFISGAASRPSLMQHSTLLCVTESRSIPQHVSTVPYIPYLHVVSLEHHAKNRTVGIPSPNTYFIFPPA